MIGTLGLGLRDPFSRRVAAIVSDAVTAMGFELVRIRLTGRERRVLQIMIDRADGAMPTVDDCAGVSRTVSTLLDVEDPVQGAYDLEISSPGIDRPLVRPADFERYAGCEAKLELVAPVDGRKRYRGRLIDIDAGGRIRLKTETGEEILAYDNLVKARLVLTDDLIARTAACAKDR